MSADLDALAAYVASLTTFAKPVPQCRRLADGGGVAGRDVFRAANAPRATAARVHRQRCRRPARRRHDQAAGERQAAGRTLTGIDTPTLRDVWATAPYLHDGSAPTIADAITAHKPA